MKNLGYIMLAISKFVQIHLYSILSLYQIQCHLESIFVKEDFGKIKKEVKMPSWAMDCWANVDDVICFYNNRCSKSLKEI